MDKELNIYKKTTIEKINGLNLYKHHYFIQNCHTSFSNMIRRIGSKVKFPQWVAKVKTSTKNFIVEDVERNISLIPTKNKVGHTVKKKIKPDGIFLEFDNYIFATIEKDGFVEVDAEVVNEYGNPSCIEYSCIVKNNPYSDIVKNVFGIKKFKDSNSMEISGLEYYDYYICFTNHLENFNSILLSEILDQIENFKKNIIFEVKDKNIYSIHSKDSYVSIPTAIAYMCYLKDPEIELVKHRIDNYFDSHSYIDIKHHDVKNIVNESIKDLKNIIKTKI